MLGGVRLDGKAVTQMTTLPWRNEPMTHEEFITILKGLRFALTHSSDLEEAIRNFDEITNDMAKKKETQPDNE